MDNEKLLNKIISEAKSSSGSISDSICEIIRRMILSGELPAGFSFPNETVFCEQLGVGRSTLREAYKALESGGYVRRTKRGTFVNDRSELYKTASVVMDIGKPDQNALLEFRAMVESEFAALAAKRATGENIAKLRECLESMKKNRDDVSRLTYFDTAFHMEIAAASHNQLMINTMHMARDAFFKGVYDAFQIDTENNIDQAIRYHEGILLAIEQHDSAMAGNIMRSHVESVKKRLGE